MTDNTQGKTYTVKINIGYPLLLLFVVLKLTDVINWSWLWVLSPLWIPLLVVAIVLCTVRMVQLFRR